MKKMRFAGLVCTLLTVFSTGSCQKQKDAAPANREVSALSHSGDMVLVQWQVAAPGCFGSEVTYPLASGKDTTVLIPGYRTACQLLNFDPASALLKYRTLYLKDSTSTDTSYSGYTTISSITQGAYMLPVKTSRYNLGGAQYAGRYKDEDGHIKAFALAAGSAALYDGGGRAIGTVTQAVKLNMGTQKDMKIAGTTLTFVWAWATDAGLSGWIARNALSDPPGLLTGDSPFAITDPAPPRESSTALKIDATAGTARLAGLIHRSSDGEIPTSGGNEGTDYAGRNPGPLNYVYLERAVPNVQKGGTSKDSMPDGSAFIAGLDRYGRPITETMTMYRKGDLNKPVAVTFIYGRPSGSSDYGWVAVADLDGL